jgi:hypothetical protein
MPVAIDRTLRFGFDPASIHCFDGATGVSLASA